MWLNFSKIELEVLHMLCEGSASAGELAKKLRKKNSFISRTLGKLRQKGMAVKGRQEISLSQAAQAQSFKRLYDSRPDAKIEAWFCSSAMDVLIVLAGFNEGCELGALVAEIGCSKPTMFKVLKRFYAAGVATKRGSKAMISDRLVREFAENYANGLHLLLLSQAKGHNGSIRVRKNVVARTDAKGVPHYFSQTGLSALANMGLEAVLTSYNDFYFNLDMRERNVGAEEAFVHALLLTTMQQHQDNTVLAIFLNKNMRKLNIGKMRELAKEYNILGELDTMRQALDYAQKAR